MADLIDIEGSTHADLARECVRRLIDGVEECERPEAERVISAMLDDIEARAHKAGRAAEQHEIVRSMRHMSGWQNTIEGERAIEHAADSILDDRRSSP